jgi:hypothetical protein
MSTRSYIGLKQSDGVVAIYCHSDGCPSYVGSLLLENYNTEDRIKELLELGDLSCLGKLIGDKHDFDDRSDEHSDWCVAYGRDRDEEDVDARKFKTVKDFNVSPISEFAKNMQFDDGEGFIDKFFERFLGGHEFVGPGFLLGDLLYLQIKAQHQTN